MRINIKYPNKTLLFTTVNWFIIPFEQCFFLARTLLNFLVPLWTATNCTFKLDFDLLCRRWSEAIKTRSIRKAFGMVIGSIVWKKEQQNFLLRANEEGNSIVVVVHFIAGIKITHILISKHYIENGLFESQKIVHFLLNYFL